TVRLPPQLVAPQLRQHGAQRRLGQLRGGVVELLNVDHRLLWIHDAIVDDRVHLDRDVVPGDHVLRRHIVHHRAQRYAHHAVDREYDEDRPRPLRLVMQVPQAEHAGALVLVEALDTGDAPG